MDGTIILIKQIFSKDVKDAIGQQKAIEEEREVFCTIKSVTRNEWRDAGQNGISAEMVVVMPTVNYEGERTVSLNGERKEIYRTYRPPESDEIELYIRNEVGAF